MARSSQSGGGVTYGTELVPLLFLYSQMFIINLNYIAPLEKIDARMKEHMVFLNACYREGLFIVSGRKIPRTGGIILAKGSSKEALEELMRNDPFIAHGLAEFDVIEFLASQSHPDFKKIFKE